MDRNLRVLVIRARVLDVAPREGGVDRNRILRDVGLLVREGRSPRGGRGSQLSVDAILDRFLASLPARGAWIATSVTSLDSPQSAQSLPARGAWIATNGRRSPRPAPAPLPHRQHPRQQLPHAPPRRSLQGHPPRRRPRRLPAWSDRLMTAAPLRAALPRGGTSSMPRSGTFSMPIDR